jgi:DNA-binding transcriptional regulator YhcF (GntR family)
MIKKFLEISFKKDGEHSPLYLQLESEIIQLICRGILKPGQALPSSRELAQSLQLNRKTVVATYEELSAQGWVETKERSGVYVSGHLPDTSVRAINQNSKKLIRSWQPAYPIIKQPSNGATSTYPDMGINALGTPPPLYKIDDGFPDPRIAPIEELVREYRRFGKGRLSNQFLMYGPEHGSYRLRVELANFLNRTRGMQITEKEVLITKGTQMAIYLTTQLLIRPGDSVFVPEPSYKDANQTFKLAGANLIFIHIGDIIHEVVIPVTRSQNRQLSIIIQNTELFTPFNASTDKIETLINILIHDTARNEMIVEDIKKEVRAGRKILVLTERKTHVDILQHYLKGVCETITLTGEDGEQNKKQNCE